MADPLELASPVTSNPQEPSSPDDKIKKRNRELRAQIDAAKNYRNRLTRNWQFNIDFRRGKPFSTQTDEDRIHVNIDWSITKAKQAALFSQVPQIRIDHPPQTLDPKTNAWLHPFEQKVNDTLVSAGVEAAMEEALPDCINAAGFGAIIVAREAITQDTQVPAMDLSFFPPEEQQQILQSGQLPDGSPLPMTTVPKVLDQRYVISRISPGDFLWPADFEGSDFDNAPWVGRTGRVTWAEAVKRFGLNEDDKNKFVGEEKTAATSLSYDADKDKSGSKNIVVFDEIFYKEFQYDSDATSFSTIHHLVFLSKEQDPIIDEPWRGQRTDENGQLIGCLHFPIRVLTLTYLTDEAIPPSDSAIIRPQVNELNESRTQIIQQRKHSLPVRWFDVNRIDPAIQQALIRGVWQSMIPVQGAGTNAVGEVARATMPQENFLFDKIAKADISDLVQVGEGPSGEGVETAHEAGAIQSNMQTRVTKERARVGEFVVGIAEALGGLLCIYENPDSFGPGFDPSISRVLRYSILADSTVILDSNQRLQRLIQFINFTAKSGWVNIEPVLREIATLSGLDPSLVIQPPQPRPPVEPNISLRLTGSEDLLQPLVLAFLMKSGQAPNADLIQQAKQLLNIASVPPVPPPMPGGPPMGGLPPQGLPPQLGPGPQVPPIPMPQAPEPPPPAVGGAHQHWGLMPQISKRSEEED